MVKFFKALFFEWRLRRAIKKAQRAAQLHRKKFLVLMADGRPLVISMQGVRRAIRSGRCFRKGFTARKAEEIALFVANPTPRPAQCSLL
jgi:hypothetical protein